jgi:hypothetical protein
VWGIRLVRRGQQANLLPDRKPRPGPGRLTRIDAGNLLSRLFTYHREVLTFLEDLHVSFENSQAERDVCMINVQQNVSGCFPREEGAVALARIRSSLSSLRTQGLPLFDTLHQTMAGHPLLPAFSSGP